MATIRSLIGDRPKRREDVRFLTGRGGYLDDLTFEGLTHAVVLRSPHAHAVIECVGTERARAMSGATCGSISNSVEFAVKTMTTSTPKLRIANRTTSGMRVRDST